MCQLVVLIASVLAVTVNIRKLKFFTAFRIYFFQNGIIVIDRFVIWQNDSIAELKINHYRDPKKDTIVNIALLTKVACNGVWGYITLSVPKSSLDSDYSWEVLKTIVDFKKILRGINANPFLATVMESFLKAADFDATIFPFPAVYIYLFSL